MSASNPFDDPRREKCDELAFQAERAWKARDFARSSKLFAQAAELEQQVARSVDPQLKRVRSTLAVSAVALWYKAREYQRAKQLAYGFLASGELTDEGASDLEELVDRSSREAELEKIASDPGMIPVDVKLDGGTVRHGIVQARDAKTRRDWMLKLLMRCADLVAKRDYREQGESPVSDQLIVYEARGVAASFGLRFYVAGPDQQDMFEEPTVTPAKVVTKFFALYDAASEGPQAITEAVEDTQYASDFITGFQNIAPDGTNIGSVVCSSPSWKLQRTGTRPLTPNHRQQLRSVATPSAPRKLKKGEKGVEGRLKKVVLTAESNWIEIESDGSPDGVVIVMLTSRKQRQRASGIVRKNANVHAITKYNPTAMRPELIDIWEVPTVD